MTPFSFMRRMMEDLDQMFGLDTTGLTPFARGGWSPEVEVFQKEGNLVVRADLPGLDRDDIKVNVDDGALTIEGERKTEHEEKREGYFHSERSYGSFQRRIPLPRGVDASACDASFENGVLEIKMKLPQQSAQRIQIKGGGQQEPKLSQKQQPEQAPQQQPQSQRSQPQNGPASRPH